MKIKVELEDLKQELSFGMREAIKEEMMKLRAEIIPYISESEQKEIERLYEKPSRKIAKSKKYDMAD